MDKVETRICHVKDVSNMNGTALVRAIKSYAHAQFDDTLICDRQIWDVKADLEEYAQKMSDENPRWKPAKIEVYDPGRQGIRWWISVNGETILMVAKARYNYSTSIME